MTETKRPPWWPTAEQKLHADARCAHPDVCNVQSETEQPAERAVCVHWPAWMATAPARCLACEYVPTEQIERRSELCQCRLPDCGQCTELVDKGLRAERLPRYPR